jgi:hypothetical protein
VPSTETLDNHQFEYEPRQPSNLDCLTLEGMIREKILESETTVSRVNYSTIASLAETTEQALVITLKQIL